MASTSSLYLKDPATTRFLCGGLAEVEALFGGRLPVLPMPDVAAGREVFHVQFPAAFRPLLVRYLQSLLREIGADIPAAVSRSDASRDQPDFQAAVERMLRSVRSADRRLGLVNLFWLAHTREIAEALREIEGRIPAVRRLKYALHPLLSSFYRRLDQSVRRSLEQAEPGRLEFMLGSRENTSLMDALLDDGFAFTELSIAEFDFNHFLAANKRYRLPADVFFEIYSVLFRETEKRLRDGRPRPARPREPAHAPAPPRAAPDPARRGQGDDEQPGARLPARRPVGHLGAAPVLGEGEGGGGEETLGGDHGGFPGRARGGEAVRGRLAPARPRCRWPTASARRAWPSGRAAGGCSSSATRRR